jgi:hypothetical protein
LTRPGCFHSERGLADNLGLDRLLRAATSSKLQDDFLIQVVAVKLPRFGKIWEMQSVCLPPIHEPVGRGDEALVVAVRLFALIPLHCLKCTDSVIVPVSSDDLAIRSANSSANN